MRHCHVKWTKSSLNEKHGLEGYHAAFGTYVSSFHTSKAKERIIR